MWPLLNFIIAKMQQLFPSMHVLYIFVFWAEHILMIMNLSKTKGDQLLVYVVEKSGVKR